MKKSLLLPTLLLASLTGCAFPGSSPRPDPADFARQTTNENMMQITMAKMALERGTSSEVRGYAQRLLADLQASQKELDAVAVKNGITLPTTMDGEALARIDDMGNHRGTAFDRHYMDWMVVDHHNDMYAFEDAAKFGGPIGQFAKNTLPSVRTHYERAEAVDVAIQGMRVTSPYPD